MTEPTYDELAKLFTEETGFDVDDFPAAILGFACAVLAKWGTPAVAEEPVAWYVTGCCRLLDEDEAKAEARHIGGTARAMPLYTAPQADSVTAPAGAGVAHALSDAQIEAMPVWRNFVGLWPESRREIVDAVVDLLTTPPTQATDSVLEDAARSAVRVERRVMAPCTK